MSDDGDGGGEPSLTFHTLCDLKAAIVGVVYINVAVTDRMNEKLLERAQEEFRPEAARDKIHTVLMAIVYTASFAGLAYAILTAARGIGQALVKDVSYAAWATLPSDAVCTPATPLLPFAKFATFEPLMLDLCGNVDAVIAECVKT